MKIVCLADIHGAYIDVPKGDLLIMAGDYTGMDTLKEWKYFFEWVRGLNFKLKLFIAGNHDGCLAHSMILLKDKIASVPGLVYLEDSEFSYQDDILGLGQTFKVYGAPWTPTFQNWHFMMDRNKIGRKWVGIPADTQILVTHGPAMGILDEVRGKGSTEYTPIENVGDGALRGRIRKLPGLKYHIFGHVHSAYYVKKIGETTFVNCSICTEGYKPDNKPVCFEIKEDNRNEH